MERVAAGRRCRTSVLAPATAGLGSGGTAWSLASAATGRRCRGGEQVVNACARIKQPRRKPTWLPRRCPRGGGRSVGGLPPSDTGPLAEGELLCLRVETVEP